MYEHSFKRFWKAFKCYFIGLFIEFTPFPSLFHELPEHHLFIPHTCRHALVGLLELSFIVKCPWNFDMLCLLRVGVSYVSIHSALDVVVNQGHSNLVGVGTVFTESLPAVVIGNTLKAELR